MTGLGICRRPVALAPTAALTACVLSIEPVVSDSDATFDPHLLGHWQEESGSDAAVITRGAPNTYVIAYTTSENGSARVGRFNARLGPLGHRTLLDVWPAPAANDLPAPHTDLMVGGHALFDIDVHPDVVHLTMLDADSLSAALQSGALRAILTDYVAGGPQVSAVYRPNKNLSPRVGVFVDYLSEIIASNPNWGGVFASGKPQSLR